MVSESEHAESKADFIQKLAIALKEANENDYWLDLLKESNYISVLKYNEIKNDNGEVLEVFTGIIKTSKSE